MKKKIILSSFAMGLAIFSLASCRKNNTKNDNEKKDDGKSDTTDPYEVDETKSYHFVTFYESSYDKDSEGNLRTDSNGCYTLVAAGNKLASFSANVGQKLNWLPTPTKEGYTFAGWYVDASLSTPFYYTEMPDTDLEVYARWQIDNDTIYVSPNGLPTNDGKRRSSAMTLLEASRVYKPGATIKIQAGEYKDKNTVVFGAQGDANHITKIEGEDVSSTILSFEYQTEADANQGLKVAGDYHEISNITVKKAGDNGLLLGSSNNIIENCVFTENKDTGLQIGRFSGTLQPNINTWPSNNLVLNCTSYNNCDSEGEDADGFAAKLTVGYNNVFDGCMSYWNVDDGWDLYAKQDSGRIGLVRIQNCIAFQNGKHLKKDYSGLDENFAGDGNGFKLGGTSVPCEVIVDNCISAYNYAHGFTDNSNPGHIAISNATSINNGQFANDPNDSATYKEYDNFNLNRDSIVANKNYYSNLISYYSSKSTNKKVGSDEFNGSISNAIMIQNGESYIADGALSAQSGEGFTTSKCVSKWTDPDTNKKSVDDTDPTSLIATYNTTNFHTVLRNSDSSLNISALWGVSSTVKKQINVGANLNKANSSEYDHYEFSKAVENETEDQTTAREVLNSLDLAINKDLIFNDIYLPTDMRGTTISWTSSDTNALTISTEETKVENGLYYTYGILNPRLTSDTTVKLTASITVGGKTYTKDFTITAQALDPRVGEVSGIDNTTILDTEKDSFDLNTYVVRDYTSTTLTLEANSDYTVTTTIKYVDDFMSYEDALNYTNYTTVSSLNEHGTYLIEYSFNIVGYNPVVKQRIITLVNSSDTYEVTTASAYLNSIINNKVTLSGDVSYNSGTIYAVAVARGSEAPTAEEIKSQASSFVGTYSQALTSRSFNFDMTVNSNEAIDVYFVVENSNGLGTIYELKDKIEPAINITTAKELLEALNTESGAFVLKNDIDCENITLSQSKDVSKKFKGYFNGNGYTIKNLKISVTGEGGGLFWKATGGAVILNMVLEEIHVTQADIKDSGGKTAILVGCAEEGDVTIDNVTIKNSSVNSYQRSAGIIGEIKGLKNVSASQMPKVSITNCSVISNNRDYYISSKYESTNSDGTKTITGGKYVGGIVAHVQYGAHLTIDKCFVKQNIQCFNQYSGGIVGRLDPQTSEAKISITNSVFGGILTSSSSYAGGILGGRSSGVVTVKNCVSLGSVSASNAGAIVSTNLCTSTTVGTDKVYSLNSYITFENNYRQISDYDMDMDGYADEADYLAKMALNNAWQGSNVYYSTLQNSTWWNEHMEEFMSSFELKFNSTGYQGIWFFLK